jgi:hypothetical protein
VGCFRLTLSWLFSPFLFLFFLSFLLLLSPTVSPGPASSLASVLLFYCLGLAFLCSIYGFLLMLFWFALIESASLLFVRCALRNRFPAPLYFVPRLAHRFMLAAVLALSRSGLGNLHSSLICIIIHIV